VPGQVVDTSSAEEFMREALTKISEEDLTSIVHALEEKSERFRALLTDRDPSLLTDEELRGVLRSIFSARRRADAILAEPGADRLRSLIGSLLGPGNVEVRLETFVHGLGLGAEVGVEIASELLHFSHPERYWLWSRWMWDPNVQTGSLRLVTMEEFDMNGESIGEIYLKVGEAIAFVDKTGEAVGFTVHGGRSAFGIDVFLACVYGVYMYTVLRMRMTQEFNKIMPSLPDLARRLLGVYQKER
jgi:hypothetical protein